MRRHGSLLTRGRRGSREALRGQVMYVMSPLQLSATYKSAPTNFDVMGGPEGGAIVRGKPMNSPVLPADSHHLPPAMNDVGINTKPVVGCVLGISATRLVTSYSTS